MYIWVGAVVEDDFSHMLDGLENLSKELGFSEHLFEMTLHISFKISFEVPESMFDQVVQTVKEFYSSLTGFTLRVSGVENVGEIVWLRYESRPYLSKIKDLLNALLLQKFHIALHEYDSDYLFHTTLFMSDDIEKNKKAFESLQTFVFPQQVYVHKFALAMANKVELGAFEMLSVVDVECGDKA